MPRRNRKARKRDMPRKLKIAIEPKVRIYSFPKRHRNDIYPGVVVAAGWLEERKCQAMR